MAYRAAIFDLDGTLLDTLDDLWHAVNFALGQEGEPTRSRDEVRAFLGNGVARLMQLSMPEGSDRERTAQALATFREYYAHHNAEFTAPYPQIPELLHVLAGEGVLRAVVSNKPDAYVQTLVATHFKGLFNAAVGEQAGVRRKPAPDALLAVMDELRCAPDDTVYVGDSEVDLQTAKAAGVGCIAVSWGFRDRSFLVGQGATSIADSTEELAEKILL